jgi:hypothetical protein
MRTALYYPHTEIQSEALLRSALLTWDTLEFIAPYRGFRPHYQDRHMAEAMELIGTPRAPSDADRREVHELLADLVERGVPEPLRYNGGNNREADYEVWPQKLLNETWQLLREHEVIGDLLADDDYPATQGGGLTIMSMLADVMAGETRARVTDRGLAYATLANVANYEGPDPQQAVDVAQVVPLTFKTMALEHVSLERLIAFRKRETGANGHSYRALRHHYLESLEAHVAEAAMHRVGSKDRTELDRIFEEEMDDDLRDLKDELGIAKQDAFLSKDTIAFVLAVGGLAVAGLAAAHFPIPEAFTMAGAPATVGGLLGVGSKFGAKRRDVLRKHPMAYLYQIGG